MTRFQIRTKLRRLPLRTRLTFFISLLCTGVVLITTLALDLLETKHQQTEINADVNNFHNFLQNDLITLTLTGNPDQAAEFVIKLHRFPRLLGLWAYDTKGNALFQYSDRDHSVNPTPDHLPANSPWNGTYWHRLPLSVDGEQVGFAVYQTRYTTIPERLGQNLLTDSWLLPLILALAWWIANRLSSHFVRPFQTLLEAMNKPSSESGHGHVTLDATGENEETQRLFLGYNRLEERIRSAQSALQQEIADKAFQANHDKLTGLLNRPGFEEEAERLLSDNSAQQHVFGYLDLDQFKLINDTVGHPAGDVYLQQFASLLTNWKPDFATVARLGGDEFGFLLPNTARNSAEELAQQLLDAIREARFVWEKQPFEVGASIGLATFTSNSIHLASLYQSADSACYAAKALGRDRYIWYEPGDASMLEQQHDLVALRLIRSALNHGSARFQLWAQTIEPLLKEQKDGRLRYEILLRLSEENGKLVPPGAFLPVAERHNEIVRLDCWVLWNYLEQVCAAPAHLKQLAFVDVNVTGATLIHPDFRATLERAIGKFDFPWHKLILEITETSAVRNFEQARNLIDFCKQHGIRFALDDFGTGMASFDYLKRLPFDTIKIDGAFIKSINTDPMDEAVVEFIIRAANLKGQHTVAEFVENAEIVDKLVTLGVHFGQGYHLGKPKPLTDWLGN